MRKLGLFSIFVAMALLLIISATAFALGSLPSGGLNDTVPFGDPNYVPNAAEQQAIAAKEAQATQHLQQLRNSLINRSLIDSPAPGTSRYLPVGTTGQWLETNDYAHRNYCGPGATQVALKARNKSPMPNQDAIGTQENIDPNVGVTSANVKAALNYYLNSTYYVVSTSTDQYALEGKIVLDIDNGYSLITGVKTGSMPGWSGRNVYHIIAVYGYSANDVTTNMYYVETGQSAQGFSGSYWNHTSRANFWNYVVNNNSQVW